MGGQKKLVKRLSLRIRRPGFSSQPILPCHVTLDKLQPFLGYKIITIMLHLVFVSEAHVMPQVGICRVLLSKGLLGAWPILQSFCRWADSGTAMETRQTQNGRAVPAPTTVLNK